MPGRKKLRDRELMSREALEAMSISVLRRVPGFGDVTRVTIEPVAPDQGGASWDISLHGVELHQLVRARAALIPWRKRFDLVI
jgi:hypothetical protein